MHSVSSALSDFLDAGTACIPAHLFTLTLSSGSILRWTDFASDLSYGGNTFTAGGSGTAPIVTYGGKTDAVGTEVTTAKATLGCGDSARLNGKRIPLAALDGDLKGSWMKIERVFSPADIATQGGMHVFEGPVSEAAPSSSAVELTIESGMALLNQQLPRIVFQPGCVHMLFDAGCGLSRATWTVTGTVTSGSTLTNVNSNLSQGSNYFALGVVTFTSGALAGLQRSVRFSALGTLALDRPLPQAPQVGDTFTAAPGCDKTRAACAGKFTNMARFRGFPYVPKNENGRIG